MPHSASGSVPVCHSRSFIRFRKWSKIRAGGSTRGGQPQLFSQIGHGGLYAMEAWHEPYASQRKSPLLAASPLPLPLRPAFRAVNEDRKAAQAAMQK